MKEKEIIFCTILTSMLALSVISATLAQGPRMNELLIKIYLNPDAENNDLESGYLDINDWPLAREWVQRWLAMPNQITLSHYSESAMYEFDINSQKWPTGCPIHKFYDENCLRCNQSWTLRKAIAYLTNRDAYVDEIWERWWSWESDNPVVRLDLPLLQPQQKLYWPPNVPPYEYSKAQAEKILDDANFTRLPNGTRQDPMNPGKPLIPLDFYIRQDDSNRVMAGLELTQELTSIGIQVNAYVLNRLTCMRKVMVEYNYHLYTGGWDLRKIPDQYFELYSSFTYYGPTTPWSPNYVGFCNHEFDDWASKVKYPATFEEARTALQQCGRLFLKYCPTIPLWSNVSFKAFKTGWEGVINDVVKGVDNWHTFFLMHSLGSTSVSWGFKTDIELLNVVFTDWIWCHKALDLIYDSMVRNDPLLGDPTRPEPFLAENWIVGPWNATPVGGDSDATLIIWQLRNAKWHNGQDLTPDNVTFSIDFTKRCGQSVAFNYALVSDVCEAELGPGGNMITVRMYHKSAWAVERIGSLPIIMEDLWARIEDENGHLWTDPNWNPVCVKSYDPTITDLNDNGVVDLREDGAGAWSYDTQVSSSYVKLTAWRSYYLTPEQIEQHEHEKFHDWFGDLDYSGKIGMIDLAIIARALGTNSTHYPYGSGWGQYNLKCDLDKDGDVDGLDSAVVTTNYGLCMD